MIMRRAFIGSQATRFSIILLLALLFAGAIAGTTWSLARAQASNGVYDTDGDKLIEIQYLEQLDAIRYDPNGDGAADVTGDAASYAAAFPVNTGESVCIEGCNGYELSNSLDFKDAGSYRSGSVNTAWTSTAGDGWTPIIHVDAEGAKKGYRAFFDGNNHTIANLYSRGTTSPNRATGLFGALEWVSGEIRYLGLTGVKIVGGYANTGALVATNKGNVALSYATGTVSGKGNVGGLVGNNGNTGTVAGSYSSASVSSSENYVGGLVGDNLGNITHSHATGAVSGSKNYVGGLVGYSVSPVNHT